MFSLRALHLELVLLDADDSLDSIDTCKLIDSFIMFSKFYLCLEFDM